MGKQKQDKVIVLDLELTCWEPPDSRPSDQYPEIIEIGACNLHIQSGEITDKTSYIVKPYRSQISEYCTSLTAITPKMVKGGMILKHALNKFKKNFGPANRIWATWGDDKTCIINECNIRGLAYPFGERHIDVSVLFLLKHKLTKSIGLAKACEMLEIEFEGTQHRAHNDAYNTAKVLRYCIGYDND